MNNSKKTAVLISYFSIIINIFTSFLLTPLYIKTWGKGQYGIYQMVYSLAQYILLLDFGISTTIVKFSSEYKLENDKEKEKTFISQMIIFIIIVELAILVIGVSVFFNIHHIFNSLNSNEITLSKMILLIMVINICITIVQRFFFGICMSFEKYSVVNFTSFIQLFLKLVITYPLLRYFKCGIIKTIGIELILSIFSTIFIVLYSRKIYKFNNIILKKEKKLFKQIIVFSFPVFLQSIIMYVNNYLDKTVLGVMMTKDEVADYSIAVIFVVCLNSMLSSITSVILPKTVYINKMVEKKDKWQSLIVRYGRYQFFVGGAIVGGFIAVGKDFINIWIGSNVNIIWSIALIIMIPNLVPLIQNAVNSVLDALGLRMIRSGVLLIMSLINVFLTIILVKLIGIFGAPIGTAISYVLGYGIILNIYYKKKLNIKIIKMFYDICKRTWLCAVLSVLLSIIVKRFLLYSNEFLNIKGFILVGIIYVLVYFGTLWLFGMNKTEKKDIVQMFLKSNSKKVSN